MRSVYKRLIGSALWLVAVVPGCEDGSSVSYCRSASEIFPSETLRDWKSYADYLVMFEVTDSAGSSDGIPVATLQNERILWRARYAPKLPERVQMRPAWPYEVGDRFLSPLARVRFSASDEWSPVGGCSPMLVKDGRLARSPAEGVEPQAQRALVGKTLEEAERIFERQRMDPVASRLARIPPQQRVQAVFAAKRRAARQAKRG